jgi:hypothetical protein
MTIRETILAITTGVALLLTQPAFAGGPVLVEEAFVQEARPSSEGNWIVPVVIGALILCAIACGNDGDPDVKPGPICKEGC